MKVKGCVLGGGGSSYFSDKMFDQYEWEGSAFENSSKINNFADVTLAREDGQHGEEHKVILAGQVLFH